MPGTGRPFRARDVVIDVAVFVCVCLASFIPLDRGQHASPDALRVLPFMAAAGLVLFARRRHPTTVLLICVLIGLLGALLGVPHTPGFALPIAVAMYAVARYRSRERALWFAIGLIVALPVEELVIAGAGFGATDVTAPSTLQPAVLVAFAAALGSAIRSYLDALESARERARRAEESREAEARRRVAEDRLAIARDLHDSVAHRIAVINLQAGVAARSLRDDADADEAGEARQAVSVIGDAARTVLTELNEMLGLLRSTSDRDAVDEPDLEHVDGLLSLFARSGLRVQVHVDGEPRALGAPAGTIAYRVVQEALTNAYKHGSDRSAELRLDYGRDALTIRVTNPTGGPSPASDGHGLTGMRERLATGGGTLRLHRADGVFTVEATLPGGEDASARREAPRPGPSHGTAREAA